MSRRERNSLFSVFLLGHLFLFLEDARVFGSGQSERCCEQSIAGKQPLRAMEGRAGLPGSHRSRSSAESVPRQDNGTLSIFLSFQFVLGLFRHALNTIKQNCQLPNKVIPFLTKPRARIAAGKPCLSQQAGMRDCLIAGSVTSSGQAKTPESCSVRHRTACKPRLPQRIPAHESRQQLRLGSQGSS